MSSDDRTPNLLRRNKQIDDPKMIGLWKVGRTIGKGSSGRVRIARHSKTGQYAAIKIVSKNSFLNSCPEIQDLGDQADRILLGIEREIVIMKLIDHPNIMRLYDVWETSTELYLILEYVEGGELFDYLCSKGRLSTSEALGYFQQIITAVDYCHRFNIAHRDLKPENLLLDANKNIKVADFGMAAWQVNANNGLLQTSCGSPHYAAPEIIMGHTYNGSQSDIWSCGVILFALLAGRLPFDDEELRALLEKVKFGKYEFPDDIDPLAKDLISKMLERDLSKRITIPEITKHPFYISQKPKGSPATTPDLTDIAIECVADIDPDIFANLLTLWHGTPEDELKESLKSSGPNWPKGVYHLLVAYRNKHMENYDEDEEALVLRSKRHVKTAAKFSPAPAQGMKRTSSQATNLGRSMVSIPPRCSPPTPRRASQNHSSQATVTGATGPPRIVFNSPSPPLSTSGIQSPSPLQSISSLSPVTPHSPAWEALNLPPLNVPEIRDDKVQQFFHQIVDHLNAIQIRTQLTGGSSNTSTSPYAHDLDQYSDFGGRYVNFSALPPTPASTPGSQGSRDRNAPERTNSFGLGISNNNNLTKPLSVRRVNGTSHASQRVQFADKENEGVRPASPGGIIKKSSLRRHGDKMERNTSIDRHVQIVLPPETKRTKLRKQHSFDTGSPSLSDDSSFRLSSPAMPRRSWFNNVFKFKPTSFLLLSAHDAHTTREECRRLLIGLGVQVVLGQAEGLGILKCKLDEVRDPAGVMGIIKAVRFRIELHLPSPPQTVAGYQITLHLIQEKGALSSFKNVYSRLKGEWDLDVPRIPLSDLSPALSDPSGRFAEAIYTA